MPAGTRYIPRPPASLGASRSSAVRGEAATDSDRDLGNHTTVLNNHNRGDFKIRVDSKNAVTCVYVNQSLQ